MLQLSYKPYTLQLLHPFTIANNTRCTTPIVLTEIKYQGFTGYGEASMPPYLGESHDSVQRFLAKVELSKFENPFQLAEICAYVDSIETGNAAAKASVDIALHDLVGKLLNKPWHKVIEVDASKMPCTSLTIGIDTLPVIQQKVKEAADFSVLKVKLGNANDKEIISCIREITSKAICVDVNQGWEDKHHALEMLHWLKERNVIFVEQPLVKEKLDDAYWLFERSPLPLVADEAVQRFADIEKLKGAYHGINIKLMKCTGMREAFQMIHAARKLNLNVLIGCMNESSCANMAAAQLAPLADWVDLDGPFMITNNPFASPVLKQGKISLPDLPGIGLLLKN
jgi:L-Ala-D/L-Glu epimerase